MYQVFFTLCESQMGYIWNTIMYTGKGTKFSKKYPDYGLSTSSVLSLVDALLGKGYCITMDNFYTYIARAVWVASQTENRRLWNSTQQSAQSAIRVRKGEVEERGSESMAKRQNDGIEVEI